MNVNVVIVDDHPLYREGLSSALQRDGLITVVGQADNGHDAVQLATTLCPDVVVMDLHMPNGNGIEATRTITSRPDAPFVIVLTMLEDDDSLFAAVQAGARGYLLKGVGTQDIVRTVTAVADGDVVFGPGVAARVLSSMRPFTDNAVIFPQLTDRERAVLELLADGLANREIALRLHLGYKTVRNYVSNIFTKLGVADRHEAATAARDAGLRPRPR